MPLYLDEIPDALGDADAWTTEPSIPGFTLRAEVTAHLRQQGAGPLAIAVEIHDAEDGQPVTVTATAAPFTADDGTGEYVSDLARSVRFDWPRETVETIHGPSDEPASVARAAAAGLEAYGLPLALGATVRTACGAHMKVSRLDPTGRFRAEPDNEHDRKYRYPIEACGEDYRPHPLLPFLYGYDLTHQDEKVRQQIERNRQRAVERAVYGEERTQDPDPEPIA